MADKRSASSPRAAQLQQLADQEAAELRDRHKARDGAVRQFDAAAAAIADAEQAIVRAREDQAQAIGTLVDSGLEVPKVAALLGLDARRVREVRAAGKRSPSTSPAPAEQQPALVS